MTGENPKLSIILPAYNEGCWIYKNLMDVSHTLASFLPSYEVIVVDDGSGDDTLAQTQMAAAQDEHIVVISNPQNNGKGRALCIGTEAAKGEFIAFCDADLDVHPSQLERFITVMEKTHSDVVIGSKMHPQSQVEYPWHRRFISWVYYFVLLIMFRLNVLDTQTGLKLFRAEVIKPIMRQILVKRFAFDIEVLSIVNSRGFKITSVPITIVFRRGSLNSRIKIRDILNMAVDTLAIFYRLKILHYYDRQLPPP